MWAIGSSRRRQGARAARRKARSSSRRARRPAASGCQRDRAECFGFGGDAGERGVAERGDQARITTAEATGDPSRRRGSRSARSTSGCTRSTKACRRFGLETADLADQAEQRGAANRRAEHRPHERVDPVERIVRRGPQRRVDHDHEVARRHGEHLVDQVVLRLEPVEHRLLAHADRSRRSRRATPHRHRAIRTDRATSPGSAAASTRQSSVHQRRMPPTANPDPKWSPFVTPGATNRGFSG